MLVAVAVVPASLLAATKTHSSGNLYSRIPDSGTLRKVIEVRERGRVDGVTVSLRLDHPQDRDLKITLTSPAGTTVVLANHRGGRGANFGSGPRTCQGSMATLHDFGLPFWYVGPPFDQSPVSPDGGLVTFYGEEARGPWRLEIMDDAPGKVGRLFCWKLAISRTGRETAVSTSQGVVAQLSWLDSNRDVLKFCVQPVGDFCMGLTIRRRGRILLDRPLRADCVSNWCLPTLWPPGRKPVHVVDLDRDGEPEVIVDLQRDGAHGRRYSLVYRYLPLSGRYRKALHSWGEPDYRLRDPDHDRRPEFVSADDRFGAAFTSFAGSYYPIRIWRWDHARLVDVTRRYPTLIRTDERQLWREYLRERRRKDPDVRGILAAWLADKYLLGEETDGWRRLEQANRRGDLRDWPTTGERYLKDLSAFLVRTGYARSRG